jgi:hypothetical protein
MATGVVEVVFSTLQTSWHVGVGLMASGDGAVGDEPVATGLQAHNANTNNQANWLVIFMIPPSFYES